MIDFVSNFLIKHMNLWYDILFSIGIFIFFLLLRHIFSKYIFKILLKLTAKTKTDLDDKLVLSFEQPMRVFFIFLGLFLAFNNLNLTELQDIFILRLFRSAIVILIAWGLYKFTSSTSDFVEGLTEKLNMDKILIPFFSKSIRTIVVLLTVSIIAEEWGFNVQGFIAGLGIGGLAFALAAKDTISNIFAGLVIMLDKPFSIGDWVKTTDVEGTIEDINFRNTKIRTFAQALVTVPNSKLVDSAITNWSKMGKRRITFNLGVTYTTPRHKIEKVVKRIKEMLHNHPEIHQQTIFVTFDSFNSSSLDIFLYFFTNTTVWGEFLEVKEDVNLKILKILEEEGVSVAFPSTSIYFETPVDMKTK